MRKLGRRDYSQRRFAVIDRQNTDAACAARVVLAPPTPPSEEVPDSRDPIEIARAASAALRKAV